MFRICKAEFKKLFLRPSIFVLAGILIFVLASCSFLYKPSNRNDTYISTQGYTTVSSFYSKLNATGTETNSFKGFEIKNLISARNFLAGYSVEVDLRKTLEEKIDDLVEKFKVYNTAVSEYNNGWATTTTKIDNAKQKLQQGFMDFKSYYISNISNISNEEIHILTTSDLNLSITSYLQQCIDTFDDAEQKYSGSDSEQIKAKNRYIIEQLNLRDGFKVNLLKDIEKLVPFIPDVEYVAYLHGCLDMAEDRLGLTFNGTSYSYYNSQNELNEGLYKEIKEFVDEILKNEGANEDKDNLAKLQYLATCYKQTCEQVFDIIRNSIYLNALQEYSTSQLTNFYGLENFNFYEQQEELVKQLYLFHSETFEIDYANPFNIDMPSNFTVNAYDFSHFALKLCMFIIIIYVIVIAASTITGEQASGTLKMLAIRPYKRSKILGGKLIATLLIGILLIAVSSIATLTIGALTYGLSSAPVLVVFNASSVCAMSPVFLYIILLFTLIIEMAFFVLIALAISMLFKSQVTSVAISILVYFGTLVINTLLGRVSFLKWLPFSNVSLFKYFGGSFITDLSSGTSLIKSILTSPVAVGSNFWLSFIYIAVVMAGLTVAVFKIFQHRDIR